MKLKRFVDTLVRTPEKKEEEGGTCVIPPASYSSRTYGNERIRVDGTTIVITASFESPWTHRHNKSSSPTAAVVHRKGRRTTTPTKAGRSETGGEATTPTILMSNPIAHFFQPVDTGSFGKAKVDRSRRNKATVINKSEAISALRRKGKSLMIPAITQNLWSLRAIAPLIQWLQHHRVRYVYADWECRHTNGTRTRTVSQHGVVVEDREIATQAEYVCEASFGQNLYVRTCRTLYVPGSVSTYDWWSDFKAGSVTPLAGGETKHVPMSFSVRPSEHEHRGRGQIGLDHKMKVSKGQASEGSVGVGESVAEGNDGAPVDKTVVAASETTTVTTTNPDPLATSVLSYAAAGVYSQVRQHRVYRWDRATSVHLSTTDGKNYRVWLEHCVEDAGLQKEFRKLLAALAYHLSFHA